MDIVYKAIAILISGKSSAGYGESLAMSVLGNTLTFFTNCSGC